MMNNKILIPALGIFIVIIGVIIFVAARPPALNAPSEPLPSPTEEGQTPGTDEISTPTPTAPPPGTPTQAPKPAPAPTQPAENPNAPKLTVTSPAQGATLSGPVIISAEATDKDSVSKVEFYVNGDLISADTYPPYSVSYDTLQSNNGKATIIVKAYDRLGNVQQKNLTVTFSNAPTFKEFSITPQSLPEGEKMTLKWAVSLADSCVASDGWSGTKSSVGSLALTAIKSGTFTLTCTGSGKTTTKSVSITVAPSLPSVSITAPTSGIVRGTITVTANAVDNTGVTKVEFYFDDTLLVADTTSPYSASYDTTKVPDSKYTVRARAYDLGGNVKEDSISVSTSNGNY